MNYSEIPLCEATCTKTENLVQTAMLTLLVMHFVHALYSQEPITA